ncbi:MAG: hypothetical protein II663_06540, partial [Bacteroidales bacterium]|nr:hypothetical protein [Bacteroidales bacterium]
MRKYFLPMVCMVLFAACNGSKTSFNSKDFAGKYKMEIAPDALDSKEEANALGLWLGNLLMDDIQVVFYENGDGLPIGMCWPMVPRYQAVPFILWMREWIMAL